MDKKVLQEKLQQDLNIASKVNSCLKSAGWKIFEEIIEKKEKELYNIFEIKNEQELFANRKALEKIQDAINEFKDLINTAVKSKFDLENLAGKESTLSKNV